MLDSVSNLFSDLFQWGTTVARFIRERGEGEIESDDLHAHLPPVGAPAPEARDAFTIAVPLPELARSATVTRRFLYVTDSGSQLSPTTARQLARHDQDQIFLAESNANKSAVARNIAEQLKQMSPTLASPVVVVGVGSDQMARRAVAGVISHLFPNDEWKESGDHVAHTMQQSAVMVAELPAIREDNGDIFFRLGDALDNFIRRHAHRWGGEFPPKEKPMPQPRSSDVEKARHFLNTAAVGGKSVGVYQLNSGDKQLFHELEIGVSSVPSRLKNFLFDDDPIEVGWIEAMSGGWQTEKRSAAHVSARAISDEGVYLSMVPRSFYGAVLSIGQELTSSQSRVVSWLGNRLLAVGARNLDSKSQHEIRPGEIGHYQLTQPRYYSWSTDGVPVVVDGHIVGKAKTITLSVLPSVPSLTARHQTPRKVTDVRSNISHTPAARIPNTRVPALARALVMR